MSVIEFPSGRAWSNKQRDDIAMCRGHAWSALLDYVTEVDGMITTSSWTRPDGTPHHKVSVYGMRGHDWETGVTIESPSIVTSLMQCLDRLKREEWTDKGGAS